MVSASRTLVGCFCLYGSWKRSARDGPVSGTQNDPAWVRNDGDDDLSQHMMSVLPLVTTHYLQPTLVIFVSLGVVCLPACLPA